MSGTADTTSAPAHHPTADFDAGDVVVDRDDDSDDANRAVVVNTPGKTAADWHVNGRGMLAEDNPGYPATDPVVAVVFEDDLEEARPHYGGVKPIKLSQLHAEGVKFYSFPESRLRKVDTVDLPVVSLNRIKPSPYHARNFDFEANRAFVEEIAERGHPSPPPLVRPVEDGFELVNGHKRVWACHVAGVKEIPVLTMRADDEEATRAWARRHLDDYHGDVRETALARIRDRRGTVEGLPHVDA